MATLTKTKKTTTKTSTPKTTAVKTVKAEKVHAKKDAAKDLADLFEDGLKDLYWAEKNLLKNMPKMHKNASSAELKKSLEDHMKETENQIKRIEDCFKELGKKPQRYSSASFLFFCFFFIAIIIATPCIISKTFSSLLPSGAYRDWETDRKSTRLNSSHSGESRMPSSA